MIPSPQQNYTVMVVTLTYNHTPYIEDTLKGIVMQQTDFPVVACVLDDCSTDGTADIVRRYEAQYPDLIKGFYFEENQFSKGKSTLEALIPWLDKVKYIAPCEGDDYWTDPLKLQKQVDFMESHADCSMCFHNAIKHWEDGSHPDTLFSQVEDKIYSANEIIQNWIIPTASTLFRSVNFVHKETFVFLRNPHIIYHDIVLFLSCAVHGKVYGLSNIMSVYRKNKGSATSRIEDQYKVSTDMVMKLCNHYKALRNFFFPYFGKKFSMECESLFFRHNRYGTFVSLIRNQLNYHREFVSSAFSISKSRTIINYIKVIGSIVKYGMKKLLHFN